MTPGSREHVRVLAPAVLAGTSAFVSGAGTGIGRAITQRLTELSCAVFGVGRRADPLEETAALVAGEPGSFAWRALDVRDTDAVTDALASAAQGGGLGLLVNNAGGQYISPAEDISSKGWRAVVGLNLDAVFDVTKAAYPYLRERAGSVVNLSLSGVERGSRGMAHSIAARAGVLGLTRTLVQEWSSDGIRLNCIGPGLVRTSALDNPAYQAAMADSEQDIPLGRETSVWEVAELVAFLASPAGALITGQLLQLDGGAHLGAGLHMIALDAQEVHDG